MKYLLVLLIVVLVSCNNVERNDSNLVLKEDAIISRSQNKLTIKSDTLFTVLENFINEIDSITNPFNNSVCYTLQFFEKDSDTLIGIMANINYYRLTEDEELDYEYKGVFNLMDQKIAVLDKKECLGKKFYVEDALEKIDIYKEDSVYNTFVECNEAWTFNPPRMLFQVKGDSIVLLEKYLGK